MLFGSSRKSRSSDETNLITRLSPSGSAAEAEAKLTKMERRLAALEEFLSQAQTEAGYAGTDTPSMPQILGRLHQRKLEADDSDHFIDTLAAGANINATTRIAKKVQLEELVGSVQTLLAQAQSLLGIDLVLGKDEHNEKQMRGRMKEYLAELSRFNGLEDKNAKLTTEHDALKTEADTLRNQVKTLRDENTTLQNNLSTAETKLKLTENKVVLEDGLLDQAHNVLRKSATADHKAKLRKAVAGGDTLYALTYLAEGVRATINFDPTISSVGKKNLSDTLQAVGGALQSEGISEENKPELWKGDKLWPKPQPQPQPQPRRSQPQRSNPPAQPPQEN